MTRGSLTLVGGGWGGGGSAWRPFLEAAGARPSIAVLAVREDGEDHVASCRQPPTRARPAGGDVWWVERGGDGVVVRRRAATP